MRFQQEERHWHAAHHHGDAPARHEDDPTWYPLVVRSRLRVDVFGGTADGWASLITTLGSSLLSKGNDVLVVDFTGRQVDAALVDYAPLQGIPVSASEFPVTTRSSDLLAGLDPTQLVELLTDCVRPRRTHDDTDDHRMACRRLVRTIVESLEDPPTFARLLAGAEVLGRTHLLTSANPLLTDGELDRLTARVDTVGQTDLQRTELDLLTETLHLLADEVSGAPPTHLPWPPRGLCVLTIGIGDATRKRVLERLIAHRVRYSMSAYRDGAVVIAGADHLGLPTLEALAEQARLTGARLVVLLEHLRGDNARLLGTSTSAAIMMRLGNYEEATRAADFIGKEHRFVITSVTEQVGRSFSEGISEGTSVSAGTSEIVGTNTSTSRTSNWSRNWTPAGTNRTSGKGRSSSDTRSRSEAWQSTANQSRSGSKSTGTTQTRVHEFTVEPRRIQSLPPTAYILVEPGESGGRRIVLADCNPGLTLLGDVVATTLRQRPEERPPHAVSRRRSAS